MKRSPLKRGTKPLRKRTKNPPLTKCPKCGSRKYVISIFGRICPDCFYEGKSAEDYFKNLSI